MKISDFINENVGSVFYHVTETKNIPSIMKRGLIPASNRRGIYATTNEPAIYLFKSITDAEDGVSNWLGDELDTNDTISLLEIRLDANKVIDDPELNLSASMTTESIPPSNIKLITDDF